MVPHTLVTTNCLAGKGIDNLSFLYSQVNIEKVTEFDLSQKTQALRIRSVTIWQLKLFCELSDLPLFQVSNRKQKLLELKLLQGTQKVGLILDRIGSTTQTDRFGIVLVTTTITISCILIIQRGSLLCPLQLCIVATGNKVEFSRSFVCQIVQETSKLDSRIAQNIGIRSPSLRSFRQCMLHDSFVILILQGNNLQFNTCLIAHLLTGIHIVFPGTFAQMSHLVLQPDFEVKGSHRIALS
mmetsp:Transcript_35286/g.85568  ORF Transcript_35286/g.85568 Transcript_35286/m.85568 type:complete len:240 (-) Transcript_35286:499-1218(-)